MYFKEIRFIFAGDLKKITLNSVVMYYYEKNAYMVVAAPMVIPFSGVAEYLDSELAEIISEGSDVVDFRVTLIVEKEADDPESGYYGGVTIKDWSVAPFGLVLFRDTIVNAIGDYILDNEDALVESYEVKRAFERFEDDMKELNYREAC